MAFEPALGRAARITGRALTLRCPRCGATRLFPASPGGTGRAPEGASTARRMVRRLPNWFTMTPSCALCGLVFERAQGYWVGAIYVNYAATTVIAMTGYGLLWGLAGPSTAVQLGIWIPFVILFPLWFFRYSRSVWLAVEYFVNPEP